MRLRHVLFGGGLIVALLVGVKIGQSQKSPVNPFGDNTPPTDRIKVFHQAEVDSAIQKQLTARLLEGNDLYSLNLLHRTTEPATLHKSVADLYIVQKGSGTIETGGTMLNPKSAGRSGDQTGTGIKGGTTQPIIKGDIVFIPPGVVHHFVGNTDIWYLNVHFPGK